MPKSAATSIPIAGGGTTGTGTESSTVTPAATASIPAMARNGSDEGAVEFVRFAVAQVNRAYQIADPRVLEIVFAPDCAGCEPLVADVKEVQSLKQRAARDFWTIRVITPLTWQHEQAAEVDLSIAQGEVALIDELGRPVSKITSGQYRYLIGLRWRDGQWRIVKWAQLEVR